MFIYILNAFLIVMIVRMIIMNREGKKNSGLIDAVRNVNNPDLFFEKINEVLAGNYDELFLQKAYVIKLWGICYTGVYDDWDDTLKHIDIDRFIDHKRGAATIQYNEDSILYLYLVLPEMLHYSGNEDKKAELTARLEAYRSDLEGQLVLRLHDEFEKFYSNEDDKGQKFFEQLLEGEYEGYSYSKQMIGVYKSMCACDLAKIYEEQGTPEKIADNEDLITSFTGITLGKKWVTDLGLVKYLQDETADAEYTDEDDEKLLPHEERDVSLYAAKAPDEEPAEEETEDVTAEPAEVPAEKVTAELAEEPAEEAAEKVTAELVDEPAEKPAEDTEDNGDK